MLKSVILGSALIAAPLLAQSQTAAPTTPQTQPGSVNDPGTPRTPLPADRGYDKPQPRTEAINAPNRDDVAAANMNANAATTGAGSARSAEAQIVYDADMAAWMAAMEARGEKIAADRSTYLQQQRAYADAMEAWRRQTAACQAGATAACKLPTPNPADYR